jgi:hypothetical protein
VPDLYSLGWRQGTTFNASLTAVVVGREDTEFETWVVCTQDCDLANADSSSVENVIELRPVLSDSPPQDWGIRSRRLLLQPGEFIDANSPRVSITAAKLAELDISSRDELSESRLRALKTWLGRRYDRPAVPGHLVALAREVAKRCGFKDGRPTGQKIHDVLMQFDDALDPPHVALFAVIADDVDPDSVLKWLANVASKIDAKLGVVAHIDAGTRAQTSLFLIETSYSADLTQLTWGMQEPTGV